MEVNQAFFATLCSVSRAAISKKIKNKTLIVNSGGMIDTDNPVNKAYLDKHKAKNTDIFAANELEKAGKPSVKNGVIKSVPTEKIPANTMLGMTLGELIEKFGNLEQLERYVKVQKELVATDEKEQRIQERRLVQIPKDFVTTVVFGLLETLMQRLLDIPDRLADQVIAYVQADAVEARQKIINTLSENITMSITDTKLQITNKIKNMKNKYEKEDLIQDIVSEALEKD